MDVQVCLGQKRQVTHENKHRVWRRMPVPTAGGAPTAFTSLAALEKYGCRFRLIG
jgi:hypothetical protein